MLSEHNFIKTIEDDIYPKAIEIENTCLEMFNKQFSPGRGATGFRGYNELDATIQLLESSITFLTRLAKEHNLIIHK